VRKANPQAYVGKPQGTKTVIGKHGKPSKKPTHEVAVKKKGADMSAAERKAREEAAKKLRKKSHGLSGREKLKAADASKANQAKGLASKKNFLTQGPKGAARRQRLGVKRDIKAGRKEAGRNFIVMEH
jgi:hypothetical protein